MGGPLTADSGTLLASKVSKARTEAPTVFASKAALLSPSIHLFISIIMLRAATGKLVRFKNCRLVRNYELVTEDLWALDGVIVDPMARWWASSTSDAFLDPEIIDCGGGILSPGFVDLQINGAFGVDFASPDITLAQ